MGTNLQAFYKHFYIGYLKTQKQQLHFVKIKENWRKKIKCFFCFGFLNRAGRCVQRAGRKTGRAGRSWNTGIVWSLLRGRSLTDEHWMHI